MTTRTHFVYRCYDNAGRLLYVGMTRKPEQRSAWHRAASPWFRDLASCRMIGPFEAGDAAELERVLIYYCLPIYNKARHWPRPRTLRRWAPLLEHVKAAA